MDSIRAASDGTCPHCLRAVQFNFATRYGGTPIASETVFSASEGVAVYFAECPSCHGLVVSTQHLDWNDSRERLTGTPGSEFLCWPLLGTVRPVPSDVPAPIAKDYRRAALAVNLIPEASAALSRRCLQGVLREQGYNQYDLKDQIKAAKAGLPSYVADDLDQIREVGNFAAHPNKDTSTGDIIDVEEGEAEWNLHVLDLLFDHYYVQPAKARAMRAATQAKIHATRASKTP